MPTTARPAEEEGGLALRRMGREMDAEFRDVTRLPGAWTAIGDERSER